MDTPADDTPRCTCCRRALWTTELDAGRWACERCEQGAFQQLRDLPHLFRRIDTLAALMKGSSEGGIGSPNREAPAPVRLAVLSLTANGGVVTQLQAIEDDWRKVRARPMGPTRHHSDIDGVVEFLTINLRWACERYEEIADDLKTIGHLHARLSGLDTGQPAPRTFPAPCGTDGCGGEMRVTLRTAHATCPQCGTHYDKPGIAALLPQQEAAA